MVRLIWENEQDKIEISNGNECLLNATIHYEYSDGTECDIDTLILYAESVT